MDSNPYLSSSNPFSSSDVDTLNTEKESIQGSFPHYFRSQRVRKKDIHAPWLLEPPDPCEKWLAFISVFAAIVGALLGGILLWDGWRLVVSHNYCRVYEDDFSGGINPDIWQPEVQTGGFGTGSFEMTTGGEENLFVNDFGLNIMPTLQEEELMRQKGGVVDLGEECTATNPYYCIARANAQNGTIVPPIKSARINTRKSRYITYGRVDVEAKLPVGDWIWPAIWMMPMGDEYGPWPASGEIDIMESRGNNHTYPAGGNNIASSSLHWGPDAKNDAWYHTYKSRIAKHTTYSEHYNTFTLEWSQKYLFTYINNRLKQVLYTPFTTASWDKGDFKSKVDSNGTAVQNPWKNASINAPFDKPFYLILSVAVGGTNKYFEDGVGHKPWKDDSPTAPKEFWDARDTWLPTWTQPAMQVKKVAMWQQCDGDEQSWWTNKDGTTGEELQEKRKKR